ncbi:uncharacterized protein BDCG_17352 [Blastomyces dermatitidis ER-3]|uniref:Uncharacterized protein n=1 Tax=Ajellomyces dermatitidis (strain ER-3 / ATCC MYA-2586) TaxID=559297 RepID=A0ABX2VY30_AJEDR|nr:uncharacterized protein BDCG_17352 [Blastomyces dermatitidis ER-3]OAT02049.1 hypothetical protein BDCG_17352 [Blastomyces dermatitidis ER-3]
MIISSNITQTRRRGSLCGPECFKARAPPPSYSLELSILKTILSLCFKWDNARALFPAVRSRWSLTDEMMSDTARSIFDRATQNGILRVIDITMDSQSLGVNGYAGIDLPLMV